MITTSSVQVAQDHAQPPPDRSTTTSVPHSKGNDGTVRVIMIARGADDPLTPDPRAHEVSDSPGHCVGTVGQDG